MRDHSDPDVSRKALGTIKKATYGIVAIATLLVTAVFSSEGIALESDELQSLRNAVIEMCRGGTLSGLETRIEVTGDSQLVVKNLFPDNPDLSVRLVENQWKGIKALINPDHYSECVQVTLNLLVPAIESKRNIDKDLNARIEYIRSNVFCERLIHIVSLAPLDFSELRSNASVVNSAAGQWELGPYLMGNPAALNMKTSSQHQGAGVYFSKNSQTFVFYEVLLYTETFGLSTETGLILKQIERVIDKCFTPKAFYNVEDVRYSSGPYKLSNGTVYWNFDETGFLGATKDSFIVTVGLRNYKEKKLIELSVHAPE